MKNKKGLIGKYISVLIRVKGRPHFTAKIPGRTVVSIEGFQIYWCKNNFPISMFLKARMLDLLTLNNRR